MGLSVSLLIAASFAILCTYYIGDKILVIDFSAYRPQNLKKAKLERLLAKKDTPLRNSKIRNDIKKAFERILIPLGKADQELCAGHPGKIPRSAAYHRFCDFVPQNLRY